MFRAFLAGALAALPLQLATVPFGAIFGALAVEAGMSLTQTMAMTSIVVAGASQLVALQMLIDGAPPLLIVAAAAFVNLRMAIYSAALALHWKGVGPWPRVLAAWFLNDQSYALSIRRYEARAEAPPTRAGYFFGVGTCCLACWITASLAGALLGQRIPEGWPVEFAPALVFLALAVPFLKSRADWAVAVTSGGLAVILAGLPSGTGFLLAMAVGIAVGMVVSRHG
ncbi:MAG: AzlC family ABC transporter permease [Pseudomonadota bacterium]